MWRGSVASSQTGLRPTARYMFSMQYHPFREADDSDILHSDRREQSALAKASDRAPKRMLGVALGLFGARGNAPRLGGKRAS